MSMVTKLGSTLKPKINLAHLPPTGKRAVRHDPYFRTLKMVNYLTALGAPPRAAEWQKKVPSWTMSLNNVLGCCVPAAGAHCETQWSTYAGPFTGQASFVPTDANVLKVYEDVSGYQPGNPSTDNGCDMLTFLKYWRKKGIAGHTIAAFVEVNFQDEEQVRWAIKLFGNVFLGVQLPLSVASTSGPPKPWYVSSQGPVGNASPGSWGGIGAPNLASLREISITLRCSVT